MLPLLLDNGKASKWLATTRPRGQLEGTMQKKAKHSVLAGIFYDKLFKQRPSLANDGRTDMVSRGNSNVGLSKVGCPLNY